MRQIVIKRIYEITMYSRTANRRTGAEESNSIINQMYNILIMLIKIRNNFLFFAFNYV